MAEPRTNRDPETGEECEPTDDQVQARIRAGRDLWSEEALRWADEQQSMLDDHGIFY